MAITIQEAHESCHGHGAKMDSRAKDRRKEKSNCDISALVSVLRAANSYLTIAIPVITGDPIQPAW